MRRRTKVDKCIDLLEEIVNDHHFNPSLMANLIVTSFPPYTQDKLIELMKYIYTYNKLENSLDKKLGAGKYRNNNITPADNPDTSWIHDNDNQSWNGGRHTAHINAQANVI
jgi:hypothetical protein